MAARGEDFLWLDVRSPEEYKQTRIEDPRVKLVPLGTLRRRIREIPKDKTNCPPLQGRPARLRGPDDPRRCRFQGCTDHGRRHGRLAVREVCGEEVILDGGRLPCMPSRASRSGFLWNA